MASQENTARVRTMFGNFDIQETIGQGGMGVVYRAQDVNLGRDVALKVLKDELRDNPRVVARFRREAEAIAALDHPRIVQVYSVGAVGNIPYFAMEFIEGKPLHRILRRHRFLQWKPALQIARDVAEALEAAHEAGIIHRDIKPGNILVDRAGHAYVSDFGIAKVLTAETQLTVDGTKLGTPQYMSPERVQGQEITIESDIYSLGVVLFQMLTGRLPYDAHDPVELIRTIVVEPPRRVRDIKPELSEDIERFVAYLIEKKPHDRPRSAGQVVDLINRLLEGQPLFESDSGLDNALESLREEVSTPYGDSTTGDAPGARLSAVLDRIGKRWSAQPEWARLLIVALPLMVGAFAAGQVYSAIGGRDAAPEIARAFSADAGAWYKQGELARFYAAEPGVSLMRLALDGYRVEGHGWTAGGDAYVAIAGRDGAAVCAVQPNDETVSLVVSPGDWAPADELVGLDADRATALIARPGPDGESRLVLAGLEQAGNETVLAERVAAVAVHPAGHRVAVVRLEGRNGRIVEEWTMNGAAPTAQVLFTSQLPVSGLGYGVRGEALVFQEETGAGIETHVVHDRDGRRRLTLGDVRVRGRALDGRTDRLIAFETVDDAARGVLFDAVTGARLGEFGDAVDAAWFGDGSIAFVAADADGTPQLWQVDIDSGEEPVQRTRLDGGIAPRVLVRPAGDAAAVATADGAALAFIRSKSD